MHGTRAATAGCGSLARSYRARSQVLVIEELNELAGRHPCDLDKPPIRSEESDPRSRWASNNRLVASVDGWRDIITAQRGWPLGEPRPLSKPHDEHEAILRAVRDRDPYAAAQAMHHHLVQTGTNAMKELLRENPKAGAYDPSWHDSIPKPHRPQHRVPKADK